MRYRFADHWVLHGAISRTLNRPKFDDLAPFVDEKNDRFVMGNSQLQPAASINYDLGIAYTTDTVLLAVNLFHKEIKDVIEEVDTGQDLNGKNVFRVENVGDGWNRGVELEQRLQMNFLHSSLQGLSLWGNESLFESELTDKNGVRRPLKDQPDLIANLGVEYKSQVTGTTMNLTAKFRDQLLKLNDQGDRDQEKAQWNLDINVRQNLAKNTFLFFNALNLLDSRKEKTKFKNNGELERETEATGRVFMVGVQAHF